MPVTSDYDILPTTNVASGQADAQNAATTVEYLSRLQILSKADKIRLSGIVCTIGPVSKAPDFFDENDRIWDEYSQNELFTWNS